MKLVKYNAGGFDLATSPKECLAVLVSEETVERVVNAGTAKEKTDKVKVATLNVFTDTGVVVKKGVPHYDGCETGKVQEGDSSVECDHAHWTELKTTKA